MILRILLIIMIIIWKTFFNKYFKNVDNIECNFLLVDQELTNIIGRKLVVENLKWKWNILVDQYLLYPSRIVLELWILVHAELYKNSMGATHSPKQINGCNLFTKTLKIFLVLAQQQLCLSWIILTEFVSPFFC